MLSLDLVHALFLFSSSNAEIRALFLLPVSAVDIYTPVYYIHFDFKASAFGNKFFYITVSNIDYIAEV